MTDEEYKQRMEELRRKQEQGRLDELRQKYVSAPDYDKMNLHDELQARVDLDEMNNLQQKLEGKVGNDNRAVSRAANYGDATARNLDNYLKEYKMPKDNVKTGLMAPFYDLKRNHDDMKKMKLRESDPFFHCKGNYEAASRGVYGGAAAYALDLLKEIKDVGYNGYPLEDSLRDFRANIRGQQGARAGKTLEQTCPTHHKYYK